ncbi:MAG: ABC transporter permease [Symbiobacteriia bacterium]
MALLLAGPLEQGLAYAVMVLGVFLSYRVLNFADLTVDGSFPLGGAVAAALVVAGVSPALATLAGFAAGMVAGFATGLLATRWQVSPLLAGILTMTALYSINLRVMGRANISLLRQATVVSQVQDRAIGGSFAVLLFLAVVVAVVALSLYGFLRTSFGSALRAAGDNEGMMRALGLDVAAAKRLGLALANGLAALAGALLAQYQGFADVNMGIGTIVAGLASVIIGEVLLGGGAGSSVGRGLVAAVAGSLVYRLVVFVALRAGFAATDLKLITAVLVVIAITTPRLKRAIPMLGQGS